MSTDALIAAVLMYGVAPVWLVAGFADYLCHRAQRIEATTGLRESLLHAVQMAEVGVPALLALFLEVNALVLLLMLLGLVLHEATAIWDVDYAARRREVSTVEQHVHGVLERLPWFAFVLLAILHWPAVTAGVAGDGFTLALKARPLPTAYVAALLAGMVVLGIVPFVEELWRCWRFGRTAR